MGRRRRPELLLLIVLVAFGASACGGSGDEGEQAAVATDMQVDGEMVVVDGATFAVAPSVAIDEDGDIHVAWSAHDAAPEQDSAAGEDGDAADEHAAHSASDGTGGQHVFASSSDDGGKSWSKPVRVTRAPDANAFANAHVKLLVTGDERLLLTYPRYSATGSFYTVRRSTSEDGGRTWSAPATMREGAGVGAGESYQDAAGTTESAWSSMLVTPADTQDPTTETSLAVARTLDGGVYWDPPKLVDPRTCECCDTAIAVDSKDRVFVAYRDQRIVDDGAPVRDVSVVASFDLGQTWSDPVAVRDDGWRSEQCPEAGPELAIDSKDRLHVINWRGLEQHQGIAWSRSDDQGASFESTVLVDEEFFPSATVDLAIDGDDAAWLTWDDRREDETKVWLASVDSAGAARVMDEPLAAGEQPAIAAREDLVVVAWTTADGAIEVHVSDGDGSS